MHACPGETGARAWGPQRSPWPSPGPRRSRTTGQGLDARLSCLSPLPGGAGPHGPRAGGTGGGGRGWLGAAQGFILNSALRSQRPSGPARPCTEPHVDASPPLWGLPSLLIGCSWGQSCHPWRRGKPIPKAQSKHREGGWESPGPVLERQLQARGFCAGHGPISASGTVSGTC